ncbi:bifunctional metallophosphatase/5'-nucleotidase [Haloarcula marina]|uniref:bifunctional metallophosphatase/5'-nucleotidase n=1 Tax=Haloarcula marina TaxID=2961574 RepID=UPI0020B71059|nr:5'-nucleotidase C-terminal domain-containing protein [Halomicroarcula marina]
MGPRLVHYADVEGAYDDADRIARLAATVTSLSGPDTVVAGTGDNTAPGVLSLVTEGRQALDFFEAVRPDFDVFGNHDFDHGLDATRDIVERSPQTWLSANIERDGRRYLPDVTAPWALRELGGQTVGFVGVTTPSTGSGNPAAEPLTFTDPFAAVRDASATLRDRGAELVVALSHLGREDDELARRCAVDVILGGHVHDRRVDRVDGTLLVRPGSGGKAVAVVDLGGDRPDAALRPTAEVEPAATVRTRIEERLAETGLDQTVAHVSDPIHRERMDTYGGESRIGNFVADAYRWATDADVGLQNGGGIRSDDAPLSGAVTVADLVSLVPFDERVVVAELTGRELRQLCAEGSGTTIAASDPEWWHAHLSGVELVWDRDTETVERLHVGGDPVDAEATYTVATSEYLLHTTHEFPVLTEGHRTAVDDVQYEVLAAYARTEGIDPTVSGRVVRR